MSLKAWLGRVRLERARELLTHSPLPIKAIARACGFQNERYFTTCFRRAFGQPPGAFRRSN